MSRLGGISARLLLYTYLVSSDKEITRQREKGLKLTAGLKQVWGIVLIPGVSGRAAVRETDRA